MGDSNRVSKSIAYKLDSLPPFSSKCCIYRVPENLRKVNEDAYRPLLISIGPFYYDDPRLMSMQQQKLRYLQSFLQRSTASNLDDYVQVIRGWEEEARQCYDEPINMSSDNFIDMVLVDATFIIELFLRSHFYESIEDNDRIYRKPRLLLEVTRDIRLEENQLPFFILVRLYNLVSQSSSQIGQLSFPDITHKFFMGGKGSVPSHVVTEEITHLVHFSRQYYLPSVLRKEVSNTDEKLYFTSSVRELSEAGVRFVAGKSEKLLDIRFINGVLEIPRIVVADNTDSF